MTETQGSGAVSPGLLRIAELAKRAPTMVFNNVSPQLDEQLLVAAYHATRKDGAMGVDGRSGADYSRNLTENLKDLLDRAKSGLYRAPPVRRAYIPKGNGPEKRPLGIPTFEDKVLQRAVHMVLGAIYEQDFLSCSYGFRPERNAHQALEALWGGIKRHGGGWLLEVDIRKFFDTVDHGELRKVLDQRIRDGVIRRLIDKWLNAGVLEGLELSYPIEGTPQGGVISPLLANIFLHTVLDTWFERDVKPRMRGQVFLIRYADDFVIGFEREDDARRVWEVLPKRFGRFGLTLHPDKTRLIDFHPPTKGQRHPDDGPDGRGQSFVFLGLVHTWGRSRDGRWVVRQFTAKDRFKRSLLKVLTWSFANRHQPISRQHAGLVRRVLGHINYFGVSGNMRRIACFVQMVRRGWFKSLSRRDRHPITWSDFERLTARFPLPTPRLPRSVFARVAKS